MSINRKIQLQRFFEFAYLGLPNCIARLRARGVQAREHDARQEPDDGKYDQ